MRQYNSPRDFNYELAVTCKSRIEEFWDLLDETEDIYLCSVQAVDEVIETIAKEIEQEIDCDFCEACHGLKVTLMCGAHEWYTSYDEANECHRQSYFDSWKEAIIERKFSMPPTKQIMFYLD